MKILLSLLISITACQTTMEMKAKINPASSNPNKPNIDWNVIFHENIEAVNKSKKIKKHIQLKRKKKRKAKKKLKLRLKRMPN